MTASDEFERAIDFNPEQGIIHMIHDRDVMTVASLLSRSAVVASVLSGACQQSGAYRSVPYSVDYVFWRVE